jgi:pimeloyl-ACP methyl ester carboxylesterase
LRGALEDYRAAPEDVAQDHEDQTIKIRCPTLVLWGTEFESGGKMWDFESIWREMATEPRFVALEQCGHLPHEERPEQVNAALLDFLSDWRG